MKINNVINFSGQKFITEKDLSFRKNSKQYTLNSRVYYPQKSGYVLVCSTAGTTASVLPDFPSQITSGQTVLNDGTVVWTIYDCTVSGGGSGGTTYTFISPLSENVSHEVSIADADITTKGVTKQGGRYFVSKTVTKEWITSYYLSSKCYQEGTENRWIGRNNQQIFIENGVVFFTDGLQDGETYSVDEFSGWKNRDEFATYRTLYVFESGNQFAVYVQNNLYKFSQGATAVGGGQLQFTWQNNVLTSILLGFTETFSNLGSTTTGFFRGTSTQYTDTDTGTQQVTEYAKDVAASQQGVANYVSLSSRTITIGNSNIVVPPTSSNTGTTGQIATKTASGWSWQDNTNRGMPIGSIFIYPLTVPPAGAFRLSGQRIINCQSLYPDFWSWLNNAVTAGTVRTLGLAEYENELSAYGQCGAFVINGTTVRLPLINGFIQGLGTGKDKGATVAPGLPLPPQHTHAYKDYYPTGGQGHGGELPHVLQTQSNTIRTTEVDSTLWDSDLIYKSSVDTVQPPAIKYNYCIQVFNSATELSQQQSAQIATTLQGKADVNLGNLSAHTAINANCLVDYIIKRGTGTNTWYRIWKSGWVEQGGVWTAANTGAVTVNFGVAFSSTNYCILKNRGSNDTGGTSNRTIGFYSCTTSSATTYNCAAGNSWYACGIGLSDPTGTDPLSIQYMLGM